MTFVIALLREQGASANQIMIFYALLGVACMASFRVWAGLLDRHKSGRALATLNALLGVATILPALTSAWPIVLLSGIVFGGVFLSVVASTTAFVRHNLPPHDWPAGISAFTVVFAAGQIIGPVIVGWIADSAAGQRSEREQCRRIGAWSHFFGHSVVARCVFCKSSEGIAARLLASCFCADEVFASSLASL
jgi:MFS family permease